MTDEEPDSDDDRMERANRIREMREGRRNRSPNGDDPDDTEHDTTPAADAEHGDTDTTADDGRSGASETATVDAITEAEDGDDAVSLPTSTGTEQTSDAENSPPEPAADSEADGPSDDGDTATAGAESSSSRDGPRRDVEAVLAEAGIEQTVSDPDATRDATGLGGGFTIPDQATTVTDDQTGTMLRGSEGGVAGARAAAAGGESTYTGSQTRVLEFDLGGEQFCLDIDYIEEIVELENMTRVPNSPSYIEGVVDLRGQVTAIINPKDALDVADEERGDFIVVFDSETFEEQGHIGWVVDEVRQVTPVSEADVNESPDEDDEHINGIINRDDEDEFVVWTTPDLALHSS